MDSSDIMTGVAVLVAGGFIALKMLGQISATEAKRLLQAGAKVVDVRSSGEFSSSHVKGAINVPLDELEQRISSAAPNKKTPILVYCLSGGRSAMAKGTLRRLGYDQAHNLGSLRHARRIVESS